MTNHIPSALNSFNTSLKNADAAKADLHTKHVAANAAGTAAIALETEKVLKAVGTAGKAGLSTLNAELGMLDVATGAANTDAGKDAATVKDLDAVLAALDADRKSLDEARAAADVTLNAARDRALAARAKLAPKAPEKK